MPTLPGPPVAPVQIEHDFFTAFSALVSRIKKDAHYDVADGKLLGIEGVPQPPPNPAIVPVRRGDFHQRTPRGVVLKGVFQGFDVYLTRPGAARKLVGTSLARRYMVNEPLPAAGTAEVWAFEVQYRYKNAPFGQMSQPVSVTVRG